MRMKNNLKGAVPVRPVENLRHIVYRNDEEYGDKTLYWYKEDKEDFHEYSYHRMRVEVDAIGTAFAELGVMDVGIAITGDVHPRFFATYYAATTGGGYAVPICRDILPD